MKNETIILLVIFCLWNLYDIEVLKADVKKLTEEKTITCKLAKDLSLEYLNV